MRQRARYHRFVRVALTALLCIPIFAAQPAAATFADPYEPDDTIAAASSISTDGVARLQFYEGRWLATTGHDWLRFEAVAGKVYELRVSQDTVWSLPQAAFFGPDGAPLRYETTTNRPSYQTWLFYADTTGSHFIDLSQSSYGETGTYFVSVLEGDAADFNLADSYEPDNTIRSAKSIPVDGTTQNRAHEGTDYIRFEVRAGMSYRIQIGWPQADGYMITSVVSAAGSTILGEDLAIFSRLTRYFVAGTDGTLYLKCASGIAPADPYTVAIQEMSRSVLQGVVTSAPGGAVFEGARVTVYPTAINGYTAADEPAVGTTLTASDGSWSMEVMTGFYGVRFEDPSGRLLGEYFRNVVVPAPYLTPIRAAEETTVSGIDGVLRARSGMAGRVVRAGTTEPVAGVRIYLDRIDPSSQFGSIQRLGSATSASDGTFSFPDLDPRVTHYLTASDPAGLVQVARMTVPMSPGTTSTPDFPLTTPALVNGRVTDSISGLPVPGALVTVYQGNGYYTVVATALTAADGTYSVTLRASGTTKLLFSDPSGVYKSEWWDDSYYVGNPTLFSVLVGNTYEGKDAALYPDATAPVTHALGIPAGWAYGPVSVELIGEDSGPGGTPNTYYSLGANSTPNIRYSSPVVIEAEGTTTLKYFSVDAIGNVEPVRTVAIRVDNAPPITGCDATDTYYNACTIKLSPTDSGSGVASTSYSLDGGSPKSGTSLSVGREWGSHSLSYRSIDGAGRVEETKTAEFVMGIAMKELYGTNRIDTAIALSRDSFPERADAVVLCSDKAWPDALAASGLAGVHGAPILLTLSDSAPDRVLDEIARLKPEHVFVIGGEAVVGQGVMTQLRTRFGANTVVERIAGADRYATSLVLAERTNTDEAIERSGSPQVFMVTGGTFADGVSISRQAYAERAGIVYVRPLAKAVPQNVLDLLTRTNIHAVTIIGGTAAVSLEVQAQLLGRDLASPMTVERISGADRYATSLAIVGDRRLLDGLTIVSGADFPDALCAGPSAARAEAQMVLVPGTSLGPLEAALASRGTLLTRMTWVGGPGAITPDTRLRAASVLGTPYLAVR